jgi:maleate isomerase
MSAPPGPRYRASIGTVTPSANLVVERVTAAMLADFPEVSAHFSRTPVFGSVDPFPNDYDWDGMLGAARLLAQARPDVIVWNGSKGASLGFATDHEFCRRVMAETGIAATTSTLALRVALDALGARRIALVTPYTGGYQAKLVAGFEREGLEVVAEAHANVADNLAIASVTEASITDMAHRVAGSSPDVVLTWCTNFPAAYLARRLEDELGLPVLDSVTLAVWHALRMIGTADARGRRWGSLFEREQGRP